MLLLLVLPSMSVRNFDIKEPHMIRQRAACGSRAASSPPLDWHSILVELLPEWFIIQLEIHSEETPEFYNRRPVSDTSSQSEVAFQNKTSVLRS